MISEHATAGDGTVPPDWCLKVTAVNPHDPTCGDREEEFPPVVARIRHRDVVRALNGIRSGKFKVTRATLDCAWKLVSDPEYGDLSWDGESSDELLQVIVYGRSVFL